MVPTSKLVCTQWSKYQFVGQKKQTHTTTDARITISDFVSCTKVFLEFPKKSIPAFFFVMLKYIHGNKKHISTEDLKPCFMCNISCMDFRYVAL